jgi:Ras-related protein Rab-5C
MSACSLPKKRFKVVLLGDGSVGKSSLIIRYHTNSFDGFTCHTVGNAYVLHSLNLGHEEVLLEIWDTPGQESFASASRLLVRDAHCCIIVYDVTQPESFESVATHARRYLDACVDIALVVVAAHKEDLLGAERDAETERLAGLHESTTWQTFLVSAKTGEQVSELFEYCGQRVLDLGGGKLSRERVLQGGGQRQNKECC